MATWMSAHISVHRVFRKISSLSGKNKVGLIKRDGRLEEKAVLKSSLTQCHWQWHKQKPLLSPPAGVFNPSVGLLWRIIALLTWFHKAVTRPPVPVQHNNKRGSKSEFLALFRSGRFSSLWRIILERCVSRMLHWTSHKTAWGASGLAKVLWFCCHCKEFSHSLDFISEKPDYLRDTISYNNIYACIFHLAFTNMVSSAYPYFFYFIFTKQQ